MLSQFFEAKVEVKEIKKIHIGPHSESYKVKILVGAEKKNLLIKKPLEELPGDTKRADYFNDYLAGWKISSLLDLSPRVLGCFLEPVGDTYNIYQIQEYREGESYLETLLHLSEEDSDTAKQKHKIEATVSLLLQVHKSALPPISETRKQALYKRSLREVITHPRLTLTLFDQKLGESRIFKGSFRYQYITEMLKVANHFGGYYDRLSIIHGDFWSGNILFDKANEPFFLDYSNHCYGEPGMDVGNFYIELIWLSILKNNPVYRDLANYFLGSYVKSAGDALIRNTAITYIGFTGAICLVEEYFPQVSHRQRQKFASYIFACLRQKKLLQNYEF